jgi:hypothetical protein
MSEGREKSNLDKYNDAKINYAKLDAEFKAMPKFNKDGVTISANWIKKQDKLKEADILVDELFKIKDDVTLSDGAKTHLMDLYVSITTGRNTDIENKYIKKGNNVEEDALTLYSRVKKQMFRKNEEHLKNDYIMGTPDTFTGESIFNAEFVPDMKSSWDLYTFYRTFTKPLANIYFWQTVGYQWLTNAKSGSIAFCLVDTPEPLIEAEIKRVWYKMGQPLDNDKNFIEMQQEIRKSLTYDDIDFRKRLLEYFVEWQDDYAVKIKKYVIAGREYLAKLHADLTLKQAI